jgi:hypothetical protein
LRALVPKITKVHAASFESLSIWTNEIVTALQRWLH